MDNTQEILKRFDLVSAKLGILGNQLMAAYTRAAFIEGVSDVAWGLLFLALTVAMCFGIRKYIQDEDDSPIIVLWIVGGIVFVIAFVACWSSAPQELFNPEYWAVKHLLEDFKPK